MDELKGRVYLHVGNSGITFEVRDVGWGPTLFVKTSALGNLEHTLKVHTSQRGLKEIGEMLIAASKEDYSDEYCDKARVLQEWEAVETPKTPRTAIPDPVKDGSE